jgi:hypothetical protein
MDDYVSMARLNKRGHLSRSEELIINRSDMVFASSPRLAEKCRIHSGKAILVRNAVEFVHFACPSDSSPFIDSAETRNPVVGFSGNVGPWIDAELMVEVAACRPIWDFMIVGPFNDRRTRSELSRHPNIKLNGHVPYSRLPAYIHGFDVCVMPFSNRVTWGYN